MFQCDRLYPNIPNPTKIYKLRTGVCQSLKATSFNSGHLKFNTQIDFQATLEHIASGVTPRVRKHHFRLGED